jgi:hypothetical protein
VSDPPSSEEDGPQAQPTTREIPVVPAGGAAAATPGAPPLPPHPGALPPAPVAAPEQAAPAVVGPQPTGPVDFVPGLPGAATSPPPPPLPGPGTNPAGSTAATAGTGGRTWPESLDADGPAKARRVRAPQDRATLLAIGLAVLALLLLELGLGLRFGDRSFWSRVPLWSAFATVAALLALVGLVPAIPGRAAGSANEAPVAGRSGPAWRIAAGGLVCLAVFWLLVVLPHADTNRGFVLTAALGALGAALWVGPARSR